MGNEAVVGRSACLRANNLASCAILYESLENLLLVLCGLFTTDPPCLAKVKAEEALDGASISRD